MSVAQHSGTDALSVSTERSRLDRQPTAVCVQIPYARYQLHCRKRSVYDTIRSHDAPNVYRALNNN